jgi:hypothetical protein
MRKIRLRIEEFEDVKTQVSTVDEEEEDYDDYDESEDESDIEARVATNTWDLDTSLNLGREAADWYLLMMLWLDERDEGNRFLGHTRILAEQFANYTDMVVGGELRYTLGYVAGDVLSPELFEAVRYSLSGHARSDAWENWADFRVTHKTSALYWAEEAFEAFGSNAYGGTKWAYIARVLRMFETEETSAISFVDMCWSLEHNGGQFFGKLWNTYRLQAVLNANVREDMPTLLANASPDVQQLYTEVNGDVLPA